MERKDGMKRRGGRNIKGKAKKKRMDDGRLKKEGKRKVWKIQESVEDLGKGGRVKKGWKREEKVE